MNIRMKQVQELRLTKRTAAWRWAFAASLLALPAAYGQTTPAPQAPAAASMPAIVTQAPPMSSQVEEVSVDLEVRDKKNKPFRDLKPGDITITDNDTPVTLKDLHLVTAQSQPHHLVTMVFERLGGTSAANAQRISTQMIGMMPTEGFSYSVLDIGARLRLIQGFTRDRKEAEHSMDIATYAEESVPKATADEEERNLVEAVRSGHGPDGALLSVEDRALAKSLAVALVASHQIMKEQHTTPVLAGLLALVRSQTSIQERKSILYFTENRPMDAASEAMIKAIVGAASRAGVTFYVIDMNAMEVGRKHELDNAIMNGGQPYSPAPVEVAPGHTVSAPMQQQGAAGPSTTVGLATDWNRQPSDYTNAQKNPMAELAHGTSGLYIDGQGLFPKKPLERMIEEMTTYYEATYTPPITEYDGSFRAISVKPTRPGLIVQSRAGYYALPVSAGTSVRPFELPLLKMLNQPQLPTDLKFRTAIVRLGELPDGNANSLVIEKPVSEVEVRKDPQTHLYSAHVSIVAQIKTKDGTVIEHFADDSLRRGALELLDGENSETITFQRHFFAPPGEYVLEAVMLDQFGGTAGAQRIPFEIPKTAENPSLSEVILVRDVNSYRSEVDEGDPLRYENSVVMPNVSGVVPRDQKTVSLFFILHPDAKASAPATLEMEVTRDGKPAHRTTMPMRTGTQGSAMPYLATFSSSALTPGAYRVKAILSQDGKTSEQEASFTVNGSDPSAMTSIAAGGGHGPDTGGSDGDEKILAPGNAVNGQLMITVPKNPIPPPSAGEAHAMIETARKGALGYIDSLPNFICVEVTERSTGSGNSAFENLKHKDTMAELLRYHDKAESREMLEIDGNPSKAKRDEMTGTLSSGEFGGILKAVFDESAKASFEWKETDQLGTGTVQVFDYHVSHENSAFKVRAALTGQEIMTGYHGQVYIDTATHDVRRISLIANDLPHDFPTKASEMKVDYDYVSLNSHDYLLPVRAEVDVEQGHREATQNVMLFRDYRRFGSNSEIHYDQ
jgi:VWFA-related protein